MLVGVHQAETPTDASLRSLYGRGPYTLLSLFILGNPTQRSRLGNNASLKPIMVDPTSAYTGLTLVSGFGDLKHFNEELTNSEEHRLLWDHKEELEGKALGEGFPED